MIASIVSAIGLSISMIKVPVLKSVAVFKYAKSAKFGSSL